MTRDRLNQIRKAVDYDPLCAETYIGELMRAVDQYIRDSRALRGALTDAELRLAENSSKIEEYQADAKLFEQRVEGLMAILRNQGLQVRMQYRDGRDWICVFPQGCKCEWEIGDVTCPLHKPEAT